MYRVVSRQQLEGSKRSDYRVFGYVFYLWLRLSRWLRGWSSYCPAAVRGGGACFHQLPHRRRRCMFYSFIIHLHARKTLSLYTKKRKRETDQASTLCFVLIVFRMKFFLYDFFKKWGINNESQSVSSLSNNSVSLYLYLHSLSKAVFLVWRVWKTSTGLGETGMRVWVLACVYVFKLRVFSLAENVCLYSI